MKEPITPKKIMIVEDNVINQKMSKKIVILLGHEPIQVLEAKKSFATAKEQKPDLILMDTKFPDACGVEICRSIKNDPELQDVPIILIKHSQDAETPQQIIEQSNCDECLSKPFSLDIFSEAIGKYVKCKAINWDKKK